MVDNATLTKPVLSTQQARTGVPITFPKVPGYSYELKQAISGVSLDVSNENTGQVSSTQAVSGVIVVATLDGTSIDSN